jgi:hypothetical protein|tara:strand:- start:3 stop:1037 length:1035 start_codon:yes stop_codon:yes gene_type:complete
MASLAEIRAKLQAQDNKGGGQQSGGDNAIYPFWNIPENSTSVLRFLPDGDSSNTFFWRERQMIRMEFQGIEGQPDSRRCVVNVPCNEMWGPVGSCPVLSEVREWFKDPALEDMGRKYWKKRSYVFQGFVTEGTLDETAPENPIRRFVINPSIFNIIKSALMSSDFEELPTDYEGGTDFRLTKTTKGQYADYGTSSWARRERSLDSNERAAIETHGLYTLNDYLPKQPSESELAVIAEMFEASVDGKMYDPERWGNFYRPSGVQLDTSNSAPNNGSAPKAAPAAPAPVAPAPVAPAPVAEAAPAETTDTGWKDVAPAAAPAPAPSSEAEKPSAQDILAAIRNRSN